jgi:hypothetical protein
MVNDELAAKVIICDVRSRVREPLAGRYLLQLAMSVNNAYVMKLALRGLDLSKIRCSFPSKSYNASRGWGRGKCP